MIDPSFTIRQALPSDMEFLLKTTMRELRAFEPRSMPDRIWYQEMQGVVFALTRKCHARVVCDAASPDTICGFVFGEVYPEAKTTVVHFAYMRPAFRRLGLMRAALEDLGWKRGHEIVATHWSAYLDRFNLRALNLLYNKFVLYTVS